MFSERESLCKHHVLLGADGQNGKTHYNIKSSNICFVVFLVYRMTLINIDFSSHLSVCHLVCPCVYAH